MLWVYKKRTEVLFATEHQSFVEYRSDSLWHPTVCVPLDLQELLQVRFESMLQSFFCQ
jgi:hypothetical protein